MIAISKHILHVLIFCIIGLQTSYAQKINQTKVDAKGNEMLLGQIDKNGLAHGAYSKWFTSQHGSYRVDNDIIKSIKNELRNYTITIFLGTWCGDSRREVPRFIKILEAADYPMDRLTMVALDYEGDQYKKSPGGEEKGLNIIKVPTFLFYKDKDEIGRIVESPVEFLEKDVATILSGKNYIPHHSDMPILPVD